MSDKKMGALVCPSKDWVRVKKGEKDVNLYRYVGNDPVNFVDPGGERATRNDRSRSIGPLRDGTIGNMIGQIVNAIMRPQDCDFSNPFCPPKEELPGACFQSAPLPPQFLGQGGNSSSQNFTPILLN